MVTLFILQNIFLTGSVVRSHWRGKHKSDYLLDIFAGECFLFPRWLRVAETPKSFRVLVYVAANETTQFWSAAFGIDNILNSFGQLLHPWCWTCKYITFAWYSIKVSRNSFISFVSQNTGKKMLTQWHLHFDYLYIYIYQNHLLWSCCEPYLKGAIAVFGYSASVCSFYLSASIVRAIQTSLVTFLQW